MSQHDHPFPYPPNAPCAYSPNGERVYVESMDDIGYIALRIRGPRGRVIDDLYLNPGHVEQLQSLLAAAKAAVGFDGVQP